MSNFSPWALLPPIYSIFTAGGLWLVYIIAVMDEKITPLNSQYWRRNGSLYPPFISIAGNFPPASCIFSGVMNLAAFMGFIIAFLRYLQLKTEPDKVKPCLNICSLVVFSFGCFGMTLVGNFPLIPTTNRSMYYLSIIHNLGAFMTFGLGTLVCWMQSFITLKVDLENEGRNVSIIRFLLSISITVCMVLYFTLISQHLLMHASRSQWALVMFYLIFISTFAIEFRHNPLD